MEVIYLSDKDKIKLRNPKSNSYLIAEFREALKCDPTLMIIEEETNLGFLFTKRGYLYTVYHELFNDSGNSIYQARKQISASGQLDVVIAYLHGIVNGFNKSKK